MAWASFISGRILFEDEDIRDSISILAFQQGNAISLNDLLGNAPVNDDFKDYFIDLLTEYISYSENPGCPDGEEQIPPVPIEHGNITVQGKVTNYLNYMLAQNCVELYFPNDVSPSVKNVTTVSHPLTVGNSNVGIKRYTNINTCGFSTILATVNPIYVNSTNSNVIVARPIKDTSNSNCGYTQYNFDFTDFLE
ncbi:MAG: hypothetical protein R2793_01920 [Flavobacteriaceae bacterium]